MNLGVTTPEPANPHRAALEQSPLLARVCTQVAATGRCDEVVRWMAEFRTRLVSLASGHTSPRRCKEATAILKACQDVLDVIAVLAPHAQPNGSHTASPPDLLSNRVAVLDRCVSKLATPSGPSR